MLEFGAVVLDKRGLYEKECFSSLIKPRAGPACSVIDSRSVNCNGITERMVADAPTFEQIADSVFRILDGRVWAGHNIVRFDNRRIEDEFKVCFSFVFDH